MVQYRSVVADRRVVSERTLLYITIHRVVVRKIDLIHNGDITQAASRQQPRSPLLAVRRR